MVRKVEVYDTETVSIFPVADMPAESVEGFDVLTLGTLKRRDFKWIEGHGVGMYEGLSEHLTSRFDAVVPKCDPENCQMHMEVQAYTAGGSPEEGRLVLECALRTSNLGEAEAIEAHCLANHQAIRGVFEGFVVSQAARVEALEHEIAVAEAQAQNADRQLDKIL